MGALQQFLDLILVHAIAHRGGLLIVSATLASNHCYPSPTYHVHDCNTDQKRLDRTAHAVR